MPRYSAPDNLWTLLQTRTVRDTAKFLGVDRRTVQRWKNQGVTPIPVNREKLNVAANKTRRQINRLPKAEQFPRPAKSLAVPMIGKRRYRSEKVTKEKWEELKNRAAIDPRFKFDRFRKRKNKKTKKWEYFREQDTGAVVFDATGVRMTDVAALLLSYRGHRYIVNFLYLVTRAYDAPGGLKIARGTHSASPFLMLDEIAGDPATLADTLKEWGSNGRKLLAVRIVFGRVQ